MQIIRTAAGHEQTQSVSLYYYHYYLYLIFLRRTVIKLVIPARLIFNAPNCTLGIIDVDSAMLNSCIAAINISGEKQKLYFISIKKKKEREGEKYISPYKTIQFNIY